MHRASILLAAAAMLAGTPPVDEMRREINADTKPQSGKDRSKIKAARKQRQKHKR
mgnify:CR=1 FL=1